MHNLLCNKLVIYVVRLIYVDVGVLYKESKFVNQKEMIISGYFFSTNCEINIKTF